MYLSLCEAGFSVQLAVVPVGFTITATHPVLSLITSLWRNAEEKDKSSSQKEEL